MTATDTPYPKAVARFPKLRQSLLATFDNCALSSHFEMSYRRGWSTHPQGRGRLFHKFATECMRTMQQASEKSIDVTTAIGILEDVLTQEWADRECPFCGGENILPGLSKKMERTCGDCGSLFETEFVNVPMKEVKELYMTSKKWAFDNSFDIQRIIDIEKRLDTTVRYSVGGIAVERVLTGQPDLLMLHPDSTAHAIVLDYKDTWQLPPVSEISQEGYFQQRFYAMLVMDNYRSIEGVTLREQYVRRSQTREATLWRHDLDHLRAEFSALAQRFDRAYTEQVHIPSAGHHCRWCLRPQACPVPVFTRGAVQIMDERRAKQVAAQLLVAKNVVKKSEEALKDWCKANGTVEVRDAKGKRVYGFVEQTRRYAPTQKELEDAALMNGGTLSPEQIDALYSEKVGTRFIDHAPKLEDENPLDEDERLLQSLATSLQRAAERKGVA